jgi:8-oxo-dGTP pyrophosphatase MutT (NUDIX family)
MESENALIISVLIQKNIGGKPHLFLQTRNKPVKSPAYSGLIEIPAGKVDVFENVYEAMRREVMEECGLTITKIVNDFQSEPCQPNDEDSVFVFRPFLCQQMLRSSHGRPWAGFVFLCEAEGEPKMDTSEAVDPKWASKQELEEILKKPKTVFPLQLPVLQFYLDYLNKQS